MADSSKNTNPKNLDVEEISGESQLETQVDLTEFSLEKVKLDVNRADNFGITAWEIYKLAVDTRKFEIENFWKRTVFFWGVVGILLAGYFNAKNSEEYLIFASYLGFFYNLIFSLSIRGSKYWQEHWEQIATKYEKAFQFSLFSYNMKKDIMENSNSDFYLFKPKRHSVSKLTMMLSDLTIMLWITLIIKDLAYISERGLLKFDFKTGTNFDFYTFGVCIVPIIGIIYLIIFLVNTTNKQKSKKSNNGQNVATDSGSQNKNTGKDKNTGAAQKDVGAVPKEDSIQEEDDSSDS